MLYTDQDHLHLFLKGVNGSYSYSQTIYFRYMHHD